MDLHRLADVFSEGVGGDGFSDSSSSTFFDWKRMYPHFFLFKLIGLNFLADMCQIFSRLILNKLNQILTTKPNAHIINNNQYFKNTMPANRIIKDALVRVSKQTK